MQAFINKVELKTITTKENKTFKIYELTLKVVKNDKGEIKSIKHSMSKEFFEKYIKYCGFEDMSKILGVEVEVTLGEKTTIDKKTDKRIFFEFVKFMNFKDEAGNIIYMPKEEE